MSSLVERCDQIVGLIDDCLSEIESDARRSDHFGPTPVAGQASPICRADLAMHDLQPDP